RLSNPSLATRSSQWVASRTVAVVRTPPRGPRRSGSSGSLPLVRRSRMGSSASSMGDGAVSAALGLLDDQAASARVVLSSDPDDAVVPVHVACPEARELGAAGGEEGCEHDV